MHVRVVSRDRRGLGMMNLWKFIEFFSSFNLAICFSTQFHWYECNTNVILRFLFSLEQRLCKYVSRNVSISMKRSFVVLPMIPRLEEFFNKREIPLEKRNHARKCRIVIENIEFK